jgi:hypothetical protein
MVTKNIAYLLICSILFIFQSCGIKTAKEAGLHFSTEKSKLPDVLNWKEIGFAKELINQIEWIVVISGSSNPIPLEKWNDFKASFPYKKILTVICFFNKLHFIALRIPMQIVKALTVSKCENIKVIPG